jgi:hypothetical protein
MDHSEEEENNALDFYPIPHRESKKLVMNRKTVFIEDERPINVQYKDNRKDRRRQA